MHILFSKTIINRENKCYTLKKNHLTFDRMFDNNSAYILYKKTNIKIK
jgi:hypothetical protein